MRRTFFVLVCYFVIVVLLTGCRASRPVFVETKTETVYNYIDSITYYDSITYIPKEVYYNIGWSYDTLHLETSLAKADCWVDSIFIRGTISNKNAYTQKTKTTDHYITKDSLVYKEKPTPYPVEVMVEKPLNNYLLIWSIVSTMGLLALLVFIFRKQIFKFFNSIG